MPLIQENDLFDYSKKIFEAANAPTEHAECVARLLVNANLAGHPAHGVIRIKQYVEAIKAGNIDPQAKPAIEVEAPCYANVNGNRSFGQIAATFAMDVAIKKAKQEGLSVVGCYNMSHVGRLSDYITMASEKDLVAVALCNGGGPNVAPYGGRQRVMGTNPIACSVPSNLGRSIQIDFASAASAEGKLREARNKGEGVSEGLLLDKYGNPSTDPNDFYDGGAILPIGGHKGSALSLMVEVLGGIFTGGRCSVFEDYVEGNGILFFAMRPDLFRKRGDFDKDIELLYTAVTGSKKAGGFEKLIFPGEPEEEHREKSSREGITLDDKTWKSISGIGDSLKVSFRATSANR